jgi:hypothetical protein
MAMGLSATDYEVVDLRPPAFGAWIDTTDNADALILDLENPKLAVAAVTNLRAHGKLAPVLLVSSDRPGWDDPEMRQLPAAAVLPLPISRPALLSALEVEDQGVGVVGRVDPGPERGRAQVDHLVVGRRQPHRHRGVAGDD